MVDGRRDPNPSASSAIHRAGGLDRRDGIFAAVALTGSFALQFSFDRIIGADGFFHLRASERVFGGGMPWMPLSVFSEGWVDHQLLFHLAMAPFAAALGGLVAAKAAAATFAALAAFVLWRFLRSEGCPAPFLFALLPAGLSWMFWMRMEMPRTQSLSLALLVASIGAMGKGRHGLLFGLAWVYAWTYHVSVVLLPVAVLHALVVAATSRTAPSGRLWRAPVAAGAGLLAGFAIHPHSPRTFRFLWQHVVQKVGNREALPVGLEWRDGGWNAFFGGQGEGLLIGGAAALLLLAALELLRRSGPRRSAQALFVALLAIGSTVAVGVGTKFVEYAVPLSVLAFALALRDFDPSPAGGWRRWRTAGAVVLAGLLALNGWLVHRNTVQTEPSPYELEEAAQWLHDHVPPGEVVYHFHWNDFPELVFWAPEYRYIVGLDPHFLYLADPEAWHLFDAMGGPYVGNRSDVIASRFGARWAVLRLPHVGAREALGADPGLHKVFDDTNHAVIYEVRAPQ